MRLGMALASLAIATASTADIVLLDESWTPELLITDVQARQVDALLTGMPEQAFSGEVSLRLANDRGAPNVRICGATRLALSEVPVDSADVVIHYRTDLWSERWRLEIWAHDHLVTPEPVKVLEASLDGGGAGGSLIADDTWHVARGALHAAGEYHTIPQDDWCSVYVWLVPETGWDVAHVTYVDRVEIDVLSGPAAEVRREPTRHVRPSPGSYAVGDGWVWIEGENAVDGHDPKVFGYRVDYLERQALLSGGDWAAFAPGRIAAKWEFTTADAGAYAIWCRGCLSPRAFVWRTNDGEWNAAPDDDVIDRVWLADWMGVWWFPMGTVELPAGRTVLEIADSRVEQGAAIDCFLVTMAGTLPHGDQKPWQPASMPGLGP